ncbi:MAG: aminodeoxychorismate/anthranilate synthase component II [Chloroflexi bacterium]|nr:aminodeoxychorismate/anthranilate synthase component II [Chloroflexota bacterium]
MILVIDNYDSFVYNLAQYLGELGWEPEVFRNDKITVEAIADKKPSHVVISPGPGTPDDAGISNETIRQFGGRIPILGVCLGHQCIGQVYGGTIVRASVPMHGKSSQIFHDGKTVYRGLPNPFAAARYHSLVIEPRSVPPCLEVSARTETGEIMGVRHRDYVVEGVQFHPESIMTEAGHDLLRNFLSYSSPVWKVEPDCVRR